MKGISRLKNIKCRLSFCSIRDPKIMRYAFCILSILVFGSFSYRYFMPGSTGYQLKTVVIDAGHGGKDPGCHGTKFNEKDVALSVALKLGKYIEQNFKDVKVVYTRKTDVFVELNERAAIANSNKGDLFICIHCNANPNKEVFGAETYVMGLHKTKGNLDVAKRENSSILMEDNYQKKYDGFDPNSDEANIIFTMYQNAYLAQSLSLAAKIQEQYKTKAGRTDKGVKQAGFLVLWKTAMPSLLTETGFLTNLEEEKFLGSEEGQDYLASCLYRAFRDYKAEVEGRSVTFTDETDQKVVAPKKEEPKAEVKPSETAEAKEAVKSPIKDTLVKISNSAAETEVKKIVEAPPTKTESSKTPAAAELVFRVQLLSSDKKIPLSSEKFKGLQDIWEYKAGNIYKYAAGNCKDLATATKLQTEIREKGYKDAFVVAFKNGERISLSEAKK